MAWYLKTGAARPLTKIPDIREADTSHKTSSVHPGIVSGWYR